MTRPEESPAPSTSSPRPPRRARAIVLVIGGRLERADVPGLCERLEVLLDDSEADHVVCDVSRVIDPDAVTVDALARLTLTAQRRGAALEVRRPSCALLDLLALLGLGEVVLVRVESGLQPGG